MDTQPGINPPPIRVECLRQMPSATGKQDGLWQGFGGSAFDKAEDWFQAAMTFAMTVSFARFLPA